MQKAGSAHEEYAGCRNLWMEVKTKVLREQVASSQEWIDSIWINMFILPPWSDWDASSSGTGRMAEESLPQGRWEWKKITLNKNV